MAADQHANPKSDIDIAQAAILKPIQEVGDKLGVPTTSLEPYGHTKAKIDFDFVDSLSDRPDGKLILVTAMTPTPAGEGKTTTTVGLGDALNLIGKKAMSCLREPSLGPCFGMKGGAAGGGYAQVVPMEDINLHFTGDMHAIGVANNLLAAAVDNHIYWGNEYGIDPRRISWRRAVDMNDRALRDIVVSLGGVANGFPRQDGFDITVASEIMAIFCLSRSVDDLKRRLGNIIVGYTRAREPVNAEQIGVAGAMAAVLKDAIKPNLVQSLENNPVFVHGGPFANIAHGCNSVLATQVALKLCDYVVTEAGFGADLGAEKFFNIKCRKAGFKPDCAVIVATVRALKMHGGIAKEDLSKENLEALSVGSANLVRHIENVKKFGVPVVVSINAFSSDSDAEHQLIREVVEGQGATAAVADHWANGSEGAREFAEVVVETINNETSDFKPIYPDDISLEDKVRTIVREIYRADDISADQSILKRFAELEKEGAGSYPVCMAKTQYSFSADASLRGAPSGFTVPIRELRLSGGAEFVVAICGDIMAMPGLPRVPAANAIDVEPNGRITGLF